MAVVNPTAANKELCTEFANCVFTEKDLDTVDAYLADDFVEYNTALPEELGDVAEAKQFWRELYEAFPDLAAEEIQTIAEDDTVVYRHRLTGTHEGSLWGIPPTMNPIDIENVAIWRVEDGKIAESKTFVDSTQMMFQLGITADDLAV
jgi:steroid delta-isomerase-like uncharacterized protein